MLSDYDLEGAIRTKRLVIKPFNKELIRENGLDLRLSNEIAFRNPEFREDMIFDPTNAKHVEKEYLVRKDNSGLVVPSHTQVLLSTMEYVKLPDNLMGFVELRSTWARHGLSMPPTIIDAGFAGTVTLEVINNAPYPILLKPKLRFAHVIFAATLNKVTNVYTGSYLNQRGVKLPKVIK
ncbi:MAG: dCTP deaminase [Candidatus Micrarchaeota archaeon]|nr:dCTP deaminase [Candidatus Micrarchaeota archaeon]MDE1824414.1 dCTP deaminase [Candidatus Micrarchaeota archaeon]MDE1850124.1 dCTP deaminase [Candidatus Micrarchaeota archaeon]